MQNGIKRLYDKIQKTLFELIPENWKEIYLYASSFNGKNGEMYFYYYQKKILKSKPISCYEIANKFGIDENAYNNALGKLYGYIKALNNFMNPHWTNLTLIIKNNTFTIQYNYNDLENSKYNDEQRRIIWGYKYLHIPIESMSTEEKNLIENYRPEYKIKPTLYSEPFYGTKPREETDDNEGTNNEHEKMIRNQILKY